MHGEELNVIKFKREMEQMINKNALNLKRLLEILTHLQSVHIDLRCLQRTKIGVCVNNIRKSFKNNQQISSKTSNLIRKWKKIAKDEFTVSKKPDNNSNNSSSSSIDNHIETAQVGEISSCHSSAATVLTDSGSHHFQKRQFTGEPVDDSASRQRTETISEYFEHFDDSEFFEVRPPSRFSSIDSGQNADTKNKRRKKSDSADTVRSVVPDNVCELRRKSIELLAEALRSSSKDQSFTRTLASKIEEFIWNDFHNGNDPCHKVYKAKIRSRLMNLRDRNNPDLLKNVISGDLPPETFARMSVEQLASASLKELRRSIEQETIEERKTHGPSESLSSTEMFACPKCSERDACYTINQEKVEGDYEPVCVISLFCKKCGHSWKVY